MEGEGLSEKKWEERDRLSLAEEQGKRGGEEGKVCSVHQGGSKYSKIHTRRQQRNLLTAYGCKCFRVPYKVSGGSYLNSLWVCSGATGGYDLVVVGLKEETESQFSLVSK